MLDRSEIVGFVPSADIEAAKKFYQQVLGLRLVKDDGFAAVFDPGGRMLRVVRAENFEPQPFTVLGWGVEDIEAVVESLIERGVVFSRFDFMDQDERGIWTAPGGDRVAWFKDPDGNILSVSMHL